MRLLPLAATGGMLARTTAAENPIKKVLKLLSEMQTTLESEAKEDDRLFKKMECWCKSNRGEKTAAVEAAQKKIGKLNGEIDEQTGLIASLTEEIKNLVSKIAADGKELAEMTELRAKEKADAEKFQGETKDTLETLGKALKVLGGVQTRGALLDESSARQLSFIQQKLVSGHSFDAVLKRDLWAVLGSLKSAKPEGKPPGSKPSGSFFLQLSASKPDGKPGPKPDGDDHSPKPKPKEGGDFLLKSSAKPKPKADDHHPKPEPKEGGDFLLKNSAKPKPKGDDHHPKPKPKEGGDFLLNSAKPKPKGDDNHPKPKPKEGGDSFLQIAKSATPGFLQQPRDYSEMKPEAPTDLEGGVAGANSYNSASGGIYGVLQQMHDDFSSQLKDSIDTEATAVANFEKASAAKNEEIAAAKADKAAKQKALGDAKVAKSNAKKDLKLTTAALNEDEQFLVMLEEKCASAIDGYGERTKMRNDEIKAVGEAIGVLTSDESRDIIAKNYSFLQTVSSSSYAHAQRRHDAIMMLLESAKKTGDKRLSALAITAQQTVREGAGLDAFTKLKEMMSKLAAEIASEKEAEFRKRDSCNKDLSDNEVAQSDTTVFMEDTEKAIAKLVADMEKLDAEMAAEAASVKENEGIIAEATQTRKEENEAFKTEVRNQELTLEVLDKAKAKLTKFYGEVALLQERQQSAQEPAPKQATYSKNEQAPGVIGLFEMIMSDCKADITEAKKDEQKAQTEYEALVTDSNKSIATSKQAIAQKTTEKADATSQKAQKDLELAQAGEKMDSLQAEAAALHKDCDFLLKNFDVRQSAMESEIESIKQAIAVLSGANFDF